MQEVLVSIFHNGHVTRLVRGADHSSSVYGGVLETQLQGIALSKPLHHLASISLGQLEVLGIPHGIGEIPLIYGLTYSGCSMQYRFERQAITIESMEPTEPTEDWPYPSYPTLLPCMPLKRGATAATSWQDFSQEAPNLPELQPVEIVILCPPPATIGFSMWGAAGDAEGVTIVFECSLEKRRVVAYNVCS